MNDIWNRIRTIIIFCALIYGVLHGEPARADNVEISSQEQLDALESPGTDLTTQNLNINSGSSELSIDTTYGGAALTISGSSAITIDGGAGKSAYEVGLAGYNTGANAATLITNSQITIKNGNLTSGLDQLSGPAGTMNIDNGSTVTLAGETTDDAVIYGFGSPQASQTINLGNGSHINVTKAGTILTTSNASVNVDSNSGINVQSGAALDLTVGEWNTDQQIVTDSSGQAVYNVQGAINVDGGRVTTATPAALTMNIDGGALKVSNGGGLILANEITGDDGKVTGYEGANINITSGSAVNLSSNGSAANIWGGQVKIEGSTVDISNPSASSFSNRSALAGFDGMAIQDSTITVGPGGEIIGGSKNGMQILGSSVTLAGTGGPDTAGSAQLRFGGTSSDNAIGSGTAITVENGNYGSIGVGQSTTMSGGSIIAAGNLYIVGDRIGSDGTVSPQSFSFTQSDGQIEVKSGGALSITNGARMTASNGSLSSAGTINIDSASSLVLDNGQSNIAWTGTLNNEGALQIGGGNETTLDTTGLTTFTTTQDGSATDGTVTAGIGVMSGGTLVASKSQLFGPDNQLLETARQIYLGEDGTVKISGVLETGLDDLSDMKTALLAAGSSDNGNLLFPDAILDGPQSGVAAEALGETLANNALVYDDSSTTSAPTTTTTVASTASTGGTQLILENTPDAAEGTNAATAQVVEVGDPNAAEGSGKTFTLLGTGADNPLIVTSDNNNTGKSQVKTVQVNPYSSLNLGSESLTAEGGALGADVTLASNASLNAYAGVDGSGNINANGATFSVGAITPLAAQDGSIANDTTVNIGSGSTLVADSIGAIGADGAADTPVTNLGNQGTLNVGGDIATENLNNSGRLSAANLKITSTAGTRISGNMNISGNVTSAGRLIFDNAPVARAAASTPAESAIGGFANGADFDVDENYYLAVGNGATVDWLKNAMGKAGLSVSSTGPVQAALGVYAPIAMKAGGAIMIGTAPTRDAGDRSTLTADEANTLTLNSTGALAVNADAAATGAILAPALGGNGNNANAKLAGGHIVISGAKANQNYVVLGENADGTGWTMNGGDASQLDDNAVQLASDNPLVSSLSLVKTAGNTLTIRSGAAQSANVALPDLDGELANVIDNAFAASQIGTSPANLYTGHRGTQFLSRALRMAGTGNADNATRTLESAGRMIVIGAVPQMTLAANQAAGAAVTQRTSLAEPYGNIYVYDSGGQRIDRPQRAQSVALWIMPLFQSTNGFSMDAGPHDYDFSGRLGGVALGADYTLNDSARWGIALNMGGGYAEGSGTLHKTTNNMSFWGIGGYFGFNQDNMALMADIFYTSTYNELKQDTPAEMGFGKLKADVNGNAISTGLRMEYKAETDAMDIIPHAGFRYVNLVTDSYKIKSRGTVIKGDSIEQNIWTFPLGVTLSKDIALQDGWRFKPLLDLNVTPASGDFKSKGKIRFTGTNTKAELETKMMDYITYGGTVGLEFGNDELSLGVNYNGQFGEETSAHGVFGTFRYEF